MTTYLIDLNPGPPTIAHITPAQAATLDAFLIDGADDRTVALRLGCTTRAVHARLNRVLKTTGLPSRTALAVALLRHDLILRITAGPRRTRSTTP